MSGLLIRLFVKDYQDTTNPKVRERYGKFAGIVGVISNLFLCTIKILIGLFSGSIAIIADGINNLADASSSIITLVGFKLASRPEDETHPYGHARYEYLTGLFVSIFIIIIGLQLLKSSFEKVLHPDALQFSWLTVAVLILAILIKFWQAAFYRNVGRRIDSLTLKATAADSRNDVISTAAVLASVIFGKLSGMQIDGMMGCLVALFIIWSGIQLVRETSSPLLGEAPDEELVHAIAAAVESEPGVLGIHDLMVHNYGPGRIFASIHIEVDADGDLMESHDRIDNIERKIKNDLKIEFVAHMDPVKTQDPLIIQLKALIEDTFRALPGVESLHDFRIVPGPTHTNIIFDVVLAHDCQYPERQIRRLADQAVKEVNPDYHTVITFDRNYTTLN